MAQVPDGEDINTWDSTDAVWFKIYQDAFTGGQTWTSDGEKRFTHFQPGSPKIPAIDTDLPVSPGQASPPST